MKKIRTIFIIFSLFLIIEGITSFVHLIQIGKAAGPVTSWSAMGPFLLGLILLILLTKKTQKTNTLLSRR